MTGSTYTRRGLLRAGAGAVAVGAATGAATAQTRFGGWLSNTSNFDGTVVDATGMKTVTVEVSVSGNNGDFAFGPPAVKVDPGTTVVWKWTGKGGSHNVVEKGGAFESKLTSETGFTFERTFDSEGVVKYFCRPHEALGMKGVVVVGTDTKATGSMAGGGAGGGGDGTSDAGGGASGDGGGSEATGGEGGGETTPPANAADKTAVKTLLAMLALGFLSPLVFGLYLRFRGGGDEADRPAWESEGL